MDKRAEEAINVLKEKFHLLDSNFVTLSKKSFKIIIAKEYFYSRIELRDKITELEDFIIEKKGSSSVGRIKYKGYVTIYIKPLELQGIKSHGKENEQILLNKIKEHLPSQEVTFVSPNRKITYRNIIECTDVSKVNSHTYNKADIKLSNDTCSYNISLKKDGNFRWESSRTRYNHIFVNFLNMGKNGEITDLIFIAHPILEEKFLMVDPVSNIPYSLVIVDEFPKEDIYNIVFGNDTPSPAIVTRTFTASDFINGDNSLVVFCSRIYTNIHEIIADEVEPVLTFSHHSTQKNGIDFRAIPKSQTLHKERANVLHINYGMLV